MAKDVIVEENLEEANSEPAPVVFVSYSHDCPEHKRWVGELASRLVGSGVDVIIDQWDTGPGDDLPKFMEKSVTRANRVLAICTDAYVQKADDGTGGVGYEAMILTGELVKNLGQNKFIPIIRQPGDNAKKPKFLNTRFHVNFSDDGDFESKLEELLREIHKAPKHPKPPLGKNPFASEVKTEEARAAAPGFRLNLATGIEIPNDAREAYFVALELARNNDKLAWRKCLQRAISSFPRSLLSWRTTQGDKLPREVKDLPQWALPGVTVVSPLIALALAGVESQSEYFNNQVGLVEELLRPPGWVGSGNTLITRFPEMIVFVYQALLGSVAMQTQQVDIAQRLAWVDLPDYSIAQSPNPLFRYTRVTGWPESLNHTCTIAWAFITQLPEHWPWLNEIFSDLDHFKSALTAYYAILNIIEFLDALDQQIDLSQTQKVLLTVPVSFTVMGETISRRAFRLLQENRSAIERIWKGSKFDSQVKLEKWKEWEGVMADWIHDVYRGSRWNGSPFHSKLVTSI
ncbi:MAG: toll/interleukin-1 receptor domain-containing protein [Candidatus Acidiferrum sp.]